MMKKAELLTTNHQVQLKWLDNQVANLANDGNKAFKNANVAERAYNELNENLVLSDLHIEHFVRTHLSDIGVKKLITTLRVYLTRNNAERLQVEITRANKCHLDKLVKASGKTKIQIINQLIMRATLSEFQHPAE